MIKTKGLKILILFLCISAGIVFLSIRFVKISHEKASHRSEYAVIDHILSRQADLGESELVKEFNEQLIRELHRHFHHLPDTKDIEPKYQSQCLMCHSLLPHSKNEKIRVMLNMHSDFFSCETCHYKKEREIIQYTWYNMGIDNEITRGPKFGTRYNPETGMLKGADNHISKITPLLASKEKKEIFFMSQDHQLAKDYMKIKDRLTPGQRDQAKKKFHGDIDGKGWDCRECHRKNGVINFNALGFSPRRIVEIENLEIIGMYDKYETFHFPKW